MTATSQAVEVLWKQLAELERSVQEVIEEEVSFRKSNSQFDSTTDTVKLLVAAGERLWTEKAIVDDANFEEHSCELAYLCQHFRTSLDSGLAAHVYREKLAVEYNEQPHYSMVGSNNNRSNGHAGGGGGRAFRWPCCQSEFPPKGGWWLEATQRLVPVFQVLCAGQMVTRRACELVLGDLMFVAAGQKCEVDARVLVFLEGTMVDVSHITGRANDVRLCASTSTAPAITESRNIVLRTSYIVHGALLCMVVRTPKSSFIPMQDATATQESLDFSVDTGVPPGLSLGLCQGLFKTLCVKEQLVCRSFAVLEKLNSVQVLVVLLTKELLAEGSVPRLCSTAQKLKKAVILVNCDCGRPELLAFCDEVQVQISDGFPVDASLSGKHSSEVRDPMTPTSINESICSSPLDVGVTYEERRLLDDLVDSLGNSAKTTVIGSISEESLLHMLRLLSTREDRPLLYAAADFHFARCFIRLTSNVTRAAGRPSTSAALKQHACSPCLPSSVNELDPQKVAGANLRHNVSLIEGPSTGATSVMGSSSGGPQLMTSVTPQPGTPSTRHTSICQDAESGQMNSSRELFENPPNSTRNVVVDPLTLPEKGLLPDDSSRDLLASAVRPHVILSMNSVGVVSEQADCVLLRSELGAIGRVLETLVRKFPAGRCIR